MVFDIILNPMMLVSTGKHQDGAELEFDHVVSPLDPARACCCVLLLCRRWPAAATVLPLCCL